MTLPPRTSRWIAPIALLGLHAVVQALCLRPPSAQDGIDYFDDAWAFPDTGVEPDHRSLRIGLLLPVRGFQALFGYSEAAYYAVPLLAGALLVLATYGLGRLLFGTAVGVGAGVVLVLSDVFLMVSSLLLPDHVAAALFTSAAVLVVWVARRRERDGPATLVWARRDHAALLAAGFLFGWAYLVREFVVFGLPVVAVVFAVYGVPWRKLVWVAAPAAAVFAAEVVVNAVLYGSPLERLLASGSHGGRRDFITDSRLDALLRLPRALVDEPGAAPLAVLTALVVVAVVVRRPGLRITGAWFFLFWVPITLGTGLVVPSFRFIIADKLRYWMPILPAVVVGGLGVARHGVVLALGRRHRGPDPRARRWLPRMAVVGLALVLAVSGLAEARGRDSFRVNGADQLSELRGWLEGPGADVGVVWTDSFTARLLPMYSRNLFGDRVWKGDVRVFDDGDGGFVARDELDRGVIVLYRFGYRLLPGKYPGLPTYLRRRDGPHRDLELFREDRSLVVVRIVP